MYAAASLGKGEAHLCIPACMQSSSGTYNGMTTTTGQGQSPGLMGGDGPSRPTSQNITEELEALFSLQKKMGEGGVGQLLSQGALPPHIQQRYHELLAQAKERLAAQHKAGAGGSSSVAMEAPVLVAPTPVPPPMPLPVAVLPPAPTPAPTPVPTPAPIQPLPPAPPVLDSPPPPAPAPLPPAPPSTPPRNVTEDSAMEDFATKLAARLQASRDKKAPVKREIWVPPKAQTSFSSSSHKAAYNPYAGLSSSSSSSSLSPVPSLASTFPSPLPSSSSKTSVPSTRLSTTTAASRAKQSPAPSSVSKPLPASTSASASASAVPRVSHVVRDVMRMQKAAKALSPSTAPSVGPSVGPSSVGGSGGVRGNVQQARGA